MTLLFVYMALALGISFFCSICEAVLLSVTPAFVAHAADEGRRGSRLLCRLESNVDRPLAAILTLNTVANTAGATAVGAQASSEFGSSSVGLVSGILTFLILVCSEIVPKTLGSVHWRRLACPAAIAIHGLTWLLAPVVWATERFTRFLARGGEQDVSRRAELGAMAKVGADYGDLAPQEYRILGNLLRFRSWKVESIMTPRTVVFALPEETNVSAAVAPHSDVPFSRIPVYHECIDQTTGFVLKQDILQHQALGHKDIPLREFKRPLRSLPETACLLAAFEAFLENDDHIALVVDEYGGVEGVVTLEDVVETLLGKEIVDETDVTVDMRQLARNRRYERPPGKGVSPGT